MLNNHFLSFLGLLEKHGVEYLMVGGYAVGVHGFPRYTGDLDLFVAISNQNAGKLVSALSEFGFSSLGLKVEDFLEPDMVVEIGREPVKIQILTGIDGVTFDRCLKDRLIVKMSGIVVPVIGYDSLIAKKVASPTDFNLKTRAMGPESGLIDRSAALAKLPNGCELITINQVAAPKRL